MRVPTLEARQTAFFKTVKFPLARGEEGTSRLGEDAPQNQKKSAADCFERRQGMGWALRPNNTPAAVRCVFLRGVLSQSHESRG